MFSTRVQRISFILLCATLFILVAHAIYWKLSNKNVRWLYEKKEYAIELVEKNSNSSIKRYWSWNMSCVNDSRLRIASDQERVSKRLGIERENYVGPSSLIMSNMDFFEGDFYLRPKIIGREPIPKAEYEAALIKARDSEMGLSSYPEKYWEMLRNCLNTSYARKVVRSASYHSFIPNWISDSVNVTTPMFVFICVFFAFSFFYKLLCCIYRISLGRIIKWAWKS